MRIAGTTLGNVLEIVEDHTLLPLYLRFTSDRLAATTITAAAQNSSGNLKFQLGLLTSRFRANHPLKACFICMCEDRRDFMTPIWRREHQIPGVWVCRRHVCRLYASNLKATGVSRFQWVLPSMPQFPPAIDAPPTESAVKLADMVIGVVSRRRKPFAPLALRLAHRAALGDMGLLGGVSNGRLKHKEAGLSYANFLAPLVTLGQVDGLPSSAEAAAVEVARLIGPVRSGIHPLRHLALAAWLSRDIGEFLERYDSAEREQPIDQDIQTTVADLSQVEQADRRQRFLTLVLTGHSVSAAAREIGVDTKTGMAWAAAHGISTPRRPKLLTDDVRSSVIALLRKGVSKSQAAESGKVAVQTITTLLRTEVGLREAWKQAQFSNAQRHNRRRWERYITTNPFSGIKAARLAEPAAYAWLYRNDRAWLDGQNSKMERMARQGGLKVDWDARDAAMSAEVRRVALELAMTGASSKIRLWQIYQRLPNLKAKLAKLDRLPLTRRAIFSALQAVPIGDAGLLPRPGHSKTPGD